MDRKTIWRVNNGKEDQMNTYHWRFKIKYKKAKDRYSFTDIKPMPKIIPAILFVLLMTNMYLKGSKAIALLLSMGVVLQMLDVVEATFKLVYNFEGECTGYYEKRHRGGKPYKYIYIITNYDDKTEVKLTSNEKLFIDEKNYVGLDFTLFTKRIVGRSR